MLLANAARVSSSCPQCWEKGFALQKGSRDRVVVCVVVEGGVFQLDRTRGKPARFGNSFLLAFHPSELCARRMRYLCQSHH